LKFIFKARLRGSPSNLAASDIDVRLQGSASRQFRENLKPMDVASEVGEEFRQEVEMSGDVVASVWTIGHSTRSSEEFDEILLAYRINALVDVRSYPGSRRYPQFDKAELARNLNAIGILYSHNPQLGGRRRPSPHSRNTAWRNSSFRAYADHMETGEFKDGINELLKVAHERRTAFMCAEALWWRCHRSLIADSLKAKGEHVIHIVDAEKTEAHPYTSAARIVKGRLSYEGLLDG
jgi:uncharacterized protein (DUF488 family)